MYTIPPKKMLIINILDILKNYSDEEHRMSQKEIATILEKEYRMDVDRKAIRRNIMNLIDAGYSINYTETSRNKRNKDGTTEKSSVLSELYLERDFSDSELRLLIDSLLFSNHIPLSQCKNLVEKLSGLSNKYFKSRIKHVSTLPNTNGYNKQLFYSIDIIDEAIANNRKISFNYCHMGTDKKMHPELADDGSPKKYIVNPYQMAVANGRYYLICNFDKWDDIANIRVDRITNIEILEERAKPKSKIPELKDDFNLPKHMAEHIYMFSGPSIPVTFKARKKIVGDVIDWFGQNVTFTEESDDEVTVKTTVNENAMRLWALQYALNVRVVSPVSLAERIKNDLNEALNNYSK